MHDRPDVHVTAAKAVVDELVRLAGLEPAVVIIEILDEAGGLAAIGELIELASQYELRIISIKDVVHHLQQAR